MQLPQGELIGRPSSYKLEEPALRVDARVLEEIKQPVGLT
jgi:hypothetical protein